MVASVQNKITVFRKDINQKIDRKIYLEIDEVSQSTVTWPLHH